MMKTFNIAVIAGDGIGPEVIAEGKKVLSVAIMPCTAKKAEILREDLKRDGKQNVDYVLTTEEMITMIKGVHVQLQGQ